MIITEKNSPQGSYRLPPGPVFFNPENFISGTYHYISGVSLNDQLECSQFKENLWQRHLFNTFGYQKNSAHFKSNHLQGGSRTTWPDKNEHDQQSVEYFQRERKQLDREYDRGGLQQHGNRCQRLRQLWTAQRKVETKKILIFLNDLVTYFQNIYCQPSWRA